MLRGAGQDHQSQSYLRGSHAGDTGLRQGSRVRAWGAPSLGARPGKGRQEAV